MRGLKDLLGFGSIEEALDLKEKTDADDEKFEIQSKKDRVAFHREKVRNGPVRMTPPSNGQIRRAQARATKRQIRKNFKRDVRAYRSQQAEAATLRGHLAAVGLVDYSVEGYKPTPMQQLQSSIWLVRHFADVEEGEVFEVTQIVAAESFLRALNRWRSLVGQPVTESLPPAYVLPVVAA